MADAIETALAAAPATAAGREAAWYLGRLHGRGAGAGAEDGAHYTPELAAEGPPLTTEAEAREAWERFAARTGPLATVTFASLSEFAVEAEVATTNGRRFKLRLGVEEAPPHRIARLSFERQHDFELAVRVAGPADAAVLADLESRCPIVHDDTSVWFDRGEAYFDFSRLMEDSTVGLATVDGEPAAVTCGARHTVMIGGAPKSILTVSHLRVLPQHQRKGLWGAANSVLDKYWKEVDGSNAYIAVGNAGMQHGFKHTPDKWPVEVLFARLDCARLAGPPVGREAAPAEAAEIAGLLNAFHAGEEMFVPWTAATLAARMMRASDLYSWNRIRREGGALVGVWPAGRALKTVTARAGVETASQPGVVLDYAFAPGAEGAFEAVLRGWCGTLAQMGLDTLSIFTSKAAKGCEVICALGEAQPFNMWTPGIRVPEGAQNRGLYVDPIYF